VVDDDYVMIKIMERRFPNPVTIVTISHVMCER
jgi:hypothetical protein